MQPLNLDRPWAHMQKGLTRNGDVQGGDNLPQTLTAHVCTHSGSHGGEAGVAGGHKHGTVAIVVGGLPHQKHAPAIQGRHHCPAPINRCGMILYIELYCGLQVQVF